MREGQGEKPTTPNTPPIPQTEPSREFPYGLGLVLPTICIVGDLRIRLLDKDAPTLERTMERDAASIASQLAPLHYRHAERLLLAEDPRPLWSHARTLKKVIQPVVMNRSRARVLPEVCAKSRDAIKEAGQQIEGFLKENLKSQGVEDQFNERYMRTRDYYRALMFHVRRSCFSDESAIREAILLARATGNQADYPNVIAHIKGAKPGEYHTVVDAIYQRHPHLAPHREAITKIFEYLNRGELNLTVLPTIVKAFTSLPEESQRSISEEFYTWFASQELFFAFNDEGLGKHTVTSVKEVEEAGVAMKRLTGGSLLDGGLVRYLFVDVLRHDTSKGFANTVEELKHLNASPWYHQYQEWLEAISDRIATDSLLGLSEEVESHQISAAPSSTHEEAEFDELGGASELAIRDLQASLGKVWLTHIREIWRERNGGRLPREKEIRQSPLFDLLARGDAAREKLWVDVLTGRQQGS